MEVKIIFLSNSVHFWGINCVILETRIYSNKMHINTFKRGGFILVIEIETLILSNSITLNNFANINFM